MKNFILTAAFLLMIFYSGVNAQVSNLSAELNYNLPVGNNFIGKNYNGIFDAGIGYSFFNFAGFDFGLSGNFGLLNAEINNKKITVLIYSPRLFVEKSIWKFTPYLRAGYSFFKFNIDTNESIDKTKDGTSIKLGFKYNVYSILYFNFSYDFIRLRYEGNVDNVAYNRNIQFVNIGAAVQF